MRMIDEILYGPTEPGVRIAFTDDDDRRVREAAQLLERRGVETVSVPTLAAAYDTVAAHQADVIVAGTRGQDASVTEGGLLSVCFVDTPSDELLVCVHGPATLDPIGRASRLLRSLLMGRGVTLRTLDDPDAANARVVMCSSTVASAAPCRLLRQFGQAQSYGPFLLDLWPPIALYDPHAGVEEIVGTASILRRIPPVALGMDVPASLQ